MYFLNGVEQFINQKSDNTQITTYLQINLLIFLAQPLIITFNCSRQNPHKGQVPSCVHRPPEDRAGEGVHVQQQIHNDQKKIGAGQQSGPVGTTNQNLVPKPEGKRKKAKQEEERRKASDRRHQHDDTVPTQPNDPASRHASDGHDE